ncbi:MAG TPA: DeoR/GlpR family DNA-binding transcription regulator [Fibrobacteria bacterium]|nr:DeoR/GlpR family DNA-binding transcription regulator [Fibrobacteria bacterium]
MRTIRFRNERREKILGLLLSRQRVSVTELSKQLRVTGATIRADLEALTRENKLIRTYGGAVVPQEKNPPEAPMDVRLRNQVSEKQAIGRLASSLIQDGMVVALDASTTSLAVAAFLRNRKGLTVVTNSLAVATRLVDAPGVNVIMPGGTLRHESSSIVGPEAVQFLSRLEVELCLMGAHSVHAARGLGELNQQETEIKQALASISRRVVALADSTKWNKVSVAYFWPLAKVEILITEGQISREIKESLRSQGVRLLLAQ